MHTISSTVSTFLRSSCRRGLLGSAKKPIFAAETFRLARREVGESLGNSEKVCGYVNALMRTAVLRANPLWSAWTSYSLEQSEQMFPDYSLSHTPPANTLVSDPLPL
jgi:hypothetical protein